MVLLSSAGQVHGFSPPDTFSGPREGEEAPDFELKTVDGRTVTLGRALQSGPVVLEFGSYTCPIFRDRHGAMEKLREKFSGRASFYTVYTLEAHPKGDASPYTGREWVTFPNESRGILYRQPVSEAERKDLAETARDALGMQTEILVDGMRNSVWRAYGGAPNAAYLIGADGKVRTRQGWFNPRGMEKALARELE